MSALQLTYLKITMLVYYYFLHDNIFGMPHKQKLVVTTLSLYLNTTLPTHNAERNQDN